MSAIQDAAGFFAREAARYAGLKEAAEKFTSAAQLEQYMGELQAKVDALNAALNVDGLKARAESLRNNIAELSKQEAEQSARAKTARMEHADWVDKNAMHAEHAKVWKGEADRVLADANGKAAAIIATARGEGLAQGRIAADALKSQAAAKAKADADAYEKQRRDTLADLEQKVFGAQEKLDAIKGEHATTKNKHEELKKNIAALRAKLD